MKGIRAMATHEEHPVQLDVCASLKGIIGEAVQLAVCSGAVILGTYILLSHPNTQDKVLGLVGIALFAVPGGLLARRLTQACLQAQVDGHLLKLRTLTGVHLVSVDDLRAIAIDIERSTPRYYAAMVTWMGTSQTFRFRTHLLSESEAKALVETIRSLCLSAGKPVQSLLTAHRRKQALVELGKYATQSDEHRLILSSRLTRSQTGLVLGGIVVLIAAAFIGLQMRYIGGHWAFRFHMVLWIFALGPAVVLIASPLLFRHKVTVDSSGITWQQLRARRRYL